MTISICNSIWNTRHFQCFLMFWGLGISFALRASLSVAIISMTDLSNTNPKYEVYNWTEQIKSLLLSGYSFGSILSQIPGGILSSRYGSKSVVLIGVLFASIATLLIPTLTSIWGWQALMAIRVLEGFFHGIVHPSFYTFLAKWSPIIERGRLRTFVFTGAYVFLFIMISTSGEISFNWGWPVFFYIWGSLGCLWSGVWFMVGYSTPDDHPKISKEEYAFIKESLKEVETKEYVPVPWLKIFASIPFWGLLISQCCHDWASTILTNHTPRYLQGVFGTNPQQSGFFASLPNLAFIFMNFIIIGLDYFLNYKKRISLEFSRKLFNSIGQFGAGIGLLGLSFMLKNNLKEAVAIIITIHFFNGATSLGALINHIDISPNLAGTLVGICNVVDGLIGVASTNFIGFIVTDATNASQWKIIQITGCCVSVAGGLVFLIFGSTKVQKWNYLKK